MGVERYLKTTYRVPHVGESLMRGKFQHTLWCVTMHEIEFRGNTVPAIAERVSEFRKANRLPDGDPVEEVMKLLCEKYPGVSTTTPPPPAPEQNAPAWVSNWLKKHDKVGNQSDTESGGENSLKKQLPN